MQDRRIARAWTTQQTRLARRTALPVIGFGICAVAASVAQAGCIAWILAASLKGEGRTAAPFAAFVALLALRGGLQLAGEQAAFSAGAEGRKRLRADILARMLSAGPAMLRTAHSGDLAASVVDRVEALDGLFARWVPAAALALLGPALVCLCALAVDRALAAILLLAGLLVPVGQAVAGIGAAAASRNQFLAMGRLQARFLDRVRGIATIVLAGRADDEALALARAADELRNRTLRVLRVAFLSSAALDCAMAGALIALVLHDRTVLTAGHPPWRALFGLLLVPEFFAPLRVFASAYQDRTHATGAAEALAALPDLRSQTRPAARHHRGAWSRPRLRGCSPGLGSCARRRAE